MTRKTYGSTCYIGIRRISSTCFGELPEIVNFGEYVGYAELAC